MFGGIETTQYPRWARFAGSRVDIGRGRWATQKKKRKKGEESGGEEDGASASGKCGGGKRLIHGHSVRRKEAFGKSVLL